MLSNRSHLIVPAILSLWLAQPGHVKAGFIGDTVTITSDSSFSGWVALVACPPVLPCG